jgi:hypothetical protein
MFRSTAKPEPMDQGLVVRVSSDELGMNPSSIWNPNPSRSHRSEPYPVPHSLIIDVVVTEETAAKFSPPPYAVVLEDDSNRKALVSVAAEPGWHLWNRVVFEADSDALTVKIDLEGQSDPAKVAPHVRVDVLDGDVDESRHDLLQRGLAAQYPQPQESETEVPAWWRRPIYCGWGDQVAFSLWLEGPGRECRAVAYCTQGLYERWIARLDQAAVPFGTSTIDVGWSPAGLWVPDEIRWPDLSGFIAKEHDRGRRVLLWLGTWLWDRVPDEYCIYADDIKLAVDPTHPQVIANVQRQVEHLISPDGLDADGFKIDQLSFIPRLRAPRGGPRFGWAKEYPQAESIRMHGQGWGIELLYQYQKAIYDAAKRVKPDALITSSTVHPYFRDTFDMVRLHDTERVVGTVIDAMKIRSDLARAALPGMPIDTDDWVWGDYDQWMDYTQRSSVLGVPCIFFSERYVQSMKSEPCTKLIPIEDLRQIADAWEKQTPVSHGS